MKTTNNWIDDVADRFEDAWRALEPLQPPCILDFVAGESGDRAEALRAELERIDQAYRTKLGLTEPSVGASNVEPEAAGFPSIPGYELIEELGRGGMGVVYKARQLRPHRVVALKMMRGNASPKELARFRAETEAVAALQHPHIVQIYEVGEYSDRRAGGVNPTALYFSMEYVAGGGLNEHVAATPQPPRRAAELVETIARTIHFAHEHGIIHRDLKPANILLHKVDNRQHPIASTKGTAASSSTDYCLLTTDYFPKISDFGLAKRLDEVGQTQSGELLGTPSYMAPEQAEGRLKDIGPRTDVYALGAILYELLTGRPPHRGENVMETLDQARTQEPLPPSRLVPKLPHDLSTICLKALAKTPERRYATAETMAADLRRFLDGKPITARAVSMREKLWRWCRRNPAAAALLAAVPTFLLILAVGSLIALFNIAAKAKSEAAAKEKAEKNFQYAFEAVDKYFIQVSDRDELIERGLESLRRDLLQTAQPFLQRFIEEGQDDPRLRHELARVGVRLATIESQIGSKTEAIRLYQQALSQYDRLATEQPAPGEHLANVASIHRELAKLYGVTGKHLEAEAAFRQGYQGIEQLIKEHPDNSSYQMIQVTNLNMWGNYCREVRRLADAEIHLCQARDRLNQLALDYPRETGHRQRLALIYNDLGTLYRHTPDHGRAVRWFREAQEIQEQLARENPKDRTYRYTLASTHHNLGNYWSQNGGRADLAIAAFMEASKLDRALVREHPLILQYQEGLAKALGNLGRLGGPTVAKDALEEVVDLFERLSNSDPNVTSYALNLANAHTMLADLAGDSSESPTKIERLDRAVGILENLMIRDENYPGVKTLLRNISKGRADLLMEADRNKEALRDWDRAISLHEKPPVLWRIMRADCVARLERHAEAAENVRELLETEEAATPCFHGARVYAVCAQVAANDANLTLAARNSQAERYAATAVSLLEKAHKGGYFEDASKASHLAHPDFQQLQLRDQFKALVRIVKEEVWRRALRQIVIF